MGPSVTFLAFTLLGAAPAELTTHAQVIQYVRQQGGQAQYMDDCDEPALHLGLTGMIASDADVHRLAQLRGIRGLDL
ncbi:MAG: hypothetical protein AB7K24_34360 [Gemmataceae bacterium]